VLFLFKSHSVSGTGLSLGLQVELTQLGPVSAHQHQHKIGYINQAQHKTLVRVKRNPKSIKELHTHVA
jgi:hypothetical protein